MSVEITLNELEYSTLVGFARAGTYNADGTVDVKRAERLEVYLREYERKNEITRYFLGVRWQEATQSYSLPAVGDQRFPRAWPPQMQSTIETINRPITEQDVETLLKNRATNPTTVLVTTDPALLAGWQALESYFSA